MVMTPAQIRQFLREREALLVHFSTLMAGDPSRCFPDDLMNAKALRAVPLAFSTIQRGDSNPIPGVGRGGAEGCIGLLVDVGPETEVLAVGPADIGSSFDPVKQQWIVGGKPPTPDACEESIKLRNPSNEWFVRDYVPIGIFILPPLFARKAFNLGGTICYADAEIDKEEVFSTFRDMRVFSATDAVFKEYYRPGRGWIDMEYDNIIPPRADHRNPHE